MSLNPYPFGGKLPTGLVQLGTLPGIRKGSLASRKGNWLGKIGPLAPFGYTLSKSFPIKS
jgi:hypothetical protein